MESWEEKLQKNLLQKAVNTQFGYDVPLEEFLEKAAPIGTRRTWQGGREFVKTAEGWKPVPAKDRQLPKSTELNWKESDELARRGFYETTYKNSKLVIYPGTSGFILNVDGIARIKGTLAVCKAAAQDLIRKTEERGKELKKDAFTQPEPEKPGKGTTARRNDPGKYRKEEFKDVPFVSTPVKVGDWYTPPKSPNDWSVQNIGYHIKKIEGDVVTGGYNMSNTSLKTFPLSVVQAKADEEAKARLNRENRINRDAFPLGQELGLKNIKGGNLNDSKAINELKTALQKLKGIGEKFKTQSREFPAGGFSGANSATMTSSRSGQPISLSFNNVHHGGYYAGSTPYLVQVQVGGALDSDKQNALLRVAKQLLEKFSWETDYGKASIRETEGTAWSSVMLTAPEKYKDNGMSYHTIPSLNA
jgi:hypothetical protein